jgi:hypothetical protein
VKEATVKIRAHLGTIVLTLAIAAFAVPAALGSGFDGRSPDTKDAAIAAHSALAAPVDGRSPDTIDAAVQAHSVNLVTTPLDGRSPDTIDAALQAHSVNLVTTPLDGRSPDTIDAGLAAHSPTVTIVKSGGFSWGDFGIGFGVAAGSLLLLAGLGIGLVAARQSGRTGPATTA